jgi:DnaJ-class molecular chaperone
MQSRALARKPPDKFGAARRGDLYVRLRVQIPTRLVAGERKLYEQIRTLGSKSKRTKP